MLVDADAVKAEARGILKLVKVFVVDPVPLNGVIEPRVNINPD